MKFFWENKLTDLFLHILCINTQIGGSSDIKETQKWNDISKKKIEVVYTERVGRPQVFYLSFTSACLLKKW